MDLNELNSILQKGWPEGDDLKSFKFTVSNVYIKSLNKPDLTPSLKQEFKNNDTKEIGLSENAHAIVKVNDVRWVIKDNENVYDISKDEEELKIFLYNIPFGEEIEELGDRNAKHVKSVLSHMNSLIEKPFCDGFKDIWDKLLDKNGILNQKLPEEHPWKGKIDILLRIAALYHDIGKVIISERHSLEGFYYFAHVKPSQRGKLEKILGEGDILLGAERFKILSNMLKYHDLWGVLSTGEGSVIVLLDVLPYHIAHPIDQITTLSLLLLINMADIMEAIEPERYDSKAKLLSEEWEKLCKEVEESKGDRQELTNNLIRKDQREAIAIERIRRLLCERVPQNAPDV
ncbi:hypothetical protein FJZ33_06010, partial [Candidatus Poribacteria bacterium]|nr:hypothetical protein [Candidatus Poribacteria bacterium]